MINCKQILHLFWILQCHTGFAQKLIPGLNQGTIPGAVPDVEFLSTAGDRPRYQDDVYDSNLAQSHLVTDLPGMPFGYSHAMYAGDVSIYEPELRNNGSLFYWLYESQAHPDTDPLILWINGGPGCSAMEGALIEHGPFLAAPYGVGLTANANSWNHHINMLYLDQPVGTGYADVQDGRYAQSQKEVSIMFMTFLKRWFDVHPRFKGRPFYMGGESYAGRYLPYFGKEILASGDYNLQGIVLGNGWTDPMVQSEAFPDYSYNTGLISLEQKIIMDDMVKKCRAKYDVDPYSTETFDICEPIQWFVPKSSGTNQIGTVNQFDIRLYDMNSGEDWPFGSTGEKRVLNSKAMRKALHVTSRLEWVECNANVGKYLDYEDMYPSIKEFQYVLARTRVLLYNGQFDWICNHVGVERFVTGIDFPGKDDFTDPAQRGLWVAESKLAGYVKHGGNLSFVIILGGSHMVPLNKRPQTFDMITRFVNNRSFSDLLNTGDLGKPGLPPKTLLTGLVVEAALASDSQGGQLGKFMLPKFDLTCLALVSLGVVMGLSFQPVVRYLHSSCKSLNERQVDKGAGYHLIAN